MADTPRRIHLARPPTELAQQLPGDFAMSDDERRLAVDVLSARPNLWLFRPSQKDLAGDFIAIDMSGWRVPGRGLRKRRVWVLEQKLTGGAPGNQLSKAHAALLMAPRMELIPCRTAWVEVVRETTAEAIKRRLGLPPRKKRRGPPLPITAGDESCG